MFLMPFLPSPGSAVLQARLTGTPAPPVFAAVNPIEIVGNGEAGSPHTVKFNFDAGEPKPWPTPTRTQQWKRDSADIPGATSGAFVPTDTYSLTVTGSASNASGSAGPVTSAAVLLKPGYVTPPTIVGNPVVGQTLTVGPFTTIGQVISLTYRWLINGAERATGNSFAVQAADEGKTIEVRAEIIGVNGTTIVLSEPVVLGFSPPTVTANGITPSSGFSNSTVFHADFTTGGFVETTLIEWFAEAAPGAILATGNDVVFPNAVTGLRYNVTASNQYGSRSATSSTASVVYQSVAPAITSATIDRGGQTVAPGTILVAQVTMTGSPAPSAQLQWRIDGAAQAGATGQSFVVPEGNAGAVITFGVVASNGVAPNATATSSNSVTIAAGNTPTLSGIPDVDESVSGSAIVIDLKDYGANLDNAVYSIAFGANKTSVSLIFTVGDWAFIDWKRYFRGATRWIATGTSQTTNPFTGTPAALPSGFANSEQPGVLRAADTVAEGSYSVKLWAGDATTFASIIATLVGAEAGAATAPPAPPNENWRPEDNGDGRLRIVVLSPFPNGGSPNTDRQYEIDDDGDWISFGVTGNGTFLTDPAKFTPGMPASVRVRAINAVGTGAESDPPQFATPTSPGAAAATLDIIDDFPVSAGVMNKPLDIIDDFPVAGA